MRLRPAVALGCLCALAGCSAEQLSTSPPTTSRMTTPSIIPDVRIDDAPQASQAQSAQEYVDVPEEIWVRSASYAAGTYTLQLATAPGGTFSIQDARAVAGASGTSYTTGECTTKSERALSSRISGSLKNVTRLVTVSCPAKTAMKKPFVNGSWSFGENSGGGTGAFFVVGEEKAQGRPIHTGDTMTAQDEPVDVQVTSVALTGTTLKVQAWATEFLELSLSPTDATGGESLECTNTPPTEVRPGIRNRATQRLFDLECRPVSSIKNFQLSYVFMTGKPGEMPQFNGTSVPLTVK